MVLWRYSRHLINCPDLQVYQDQLPRPSGQGELILFVWALTKFMYAGFKDPSLL